MSAAHHAVHADPAAASTPATLEWSLVDQASAADLAVVTDGVIAHGRALAGEPVRPVAAFVRAQGRIVAGAHGRTELQRLFVHYLWVDADHRRQGLASELLRRLEAEARARGCADAALETLDDDTAAFYGRRGWRTVGLVPRWVGRFNRHLMVKPLVDPGTVRIQLERADQPDVAALIDALDAYQQPLYPPESHHGIDMAALIRPEVLMAVLRNTDGLAVGCGALVLADDGCSGELKRMYLLPAWRAGGRAQALLAFLEQAGAARGCRVFRLETGIHQHEALAFYARAGYARRGPFGDYAPDPLSVFMEKTVDR